MARQSERCKPVRAWMADDIGVPRWTSISEQRRLEARLPSLPQLVSSFGCRFMAGVAWRRLKWIELTMAGWCLLEFWNRLRNQLNESHDIACLAWRSAGSWQTLSGPATFNWP